MNDTQQPPPTTTAKKQYTEKKKGPLRLEAIVPIAIIIGLVVYYFTALFDLHLRKLIEWGGYQAMGAEVNVGSLQTSFIKGTFRLRDLQVTNADKPSHNAIQIGDIRFSFLWDGILRARMIINELAVEQIAVDSPRKKTGRVKPPPPPPPPASANSKPSALQKEAEKIKDKALDKVSSQAEGNAFVEAVSLLGKGGNVQSLPAGWEAGLASKTFMKDFEAQMQSTQKKWQEEFKKLPQAQTLQALQTRAQQIKTSGFSSPQDLQNSVNQAQTVLKDLDVEVKKVQATQGMVSSDLSTLDQGYKKLQSMIDQDIKNLQSKLGIPSIDAQSIVKSLIFSSIQPYLKRIQDLKAKVDPYIPPNVKNKAGEPDPSLKPHPRAKGVTYEFGHPTAYPMLWIRKVAISSKSTEGGFSGDVNGEILDITSNQTLTKKPTVARVQADFPAQELRQFSLRGTLDDRGAESLLDVKSSLQSFPLSAKTVVSSPDVNLGYTKGVGGTNFQFELRGLKKFKYLAANQFSKLDYVIESPNPTAKSVLQNIFSGIPMVSLDVYGEGQFPDFPVNLNSNLGPALQKGFERELQKAIAEMRQKMDAEIQRVIGEERKKIENQVNAIRGQAEGEVKKAQAQLEATRASAEAQITKAKKDFEEQAKKALGNDANKKVDELKKKLGF